MCFDIVEGHSGRTLFIVAKNIHSCMSNGAEITGTLVPRAISPFYGFSMSQNENNMSPSVKQQRVRGEETVCSHDIDAMSAT